MMSIEDFNQASASECEKCLDGVFESSPWIMKQAIVFRPYPSLHALFDRMVTIVRESSIENQLNLIKAHPKLGTRNRMSTESTEEQKTACLNQLSDDEYNQFLLMNEQYMTIFGFPFILAIKGKSKQEIYEDMETRLQHNQAEEFECALKEIFTIASFRLKDRITDNLESKQRT
ncbi:2-oxo-4-hydroxy-4-carboxy-5-ureidoimidazoline decarboxylase [Terrilactibacillus laevilacticus]|nr:2-oxo-4-hydroxy-4-carboxy-5-ureidoimidazoline decarboxylase [Terrilactibacillus laevilacticus]